MHLLQHSRCRVERNALLEHLLTCEQVSEVHIGHTALEVQDCIGMPVVSQSFLNHLFCLLVFASVNEFLRLLLQTLDIRIEAALQARFDSSSLCRRGWSWLTLHNVDLLVAILDRYVAYASCPGPCLLFTLAEPESFASLGVHR